MSCWLLSEKCVWPTTTCAVCRSVKRHISTLVGTNRYVLLVVLLRPTLSTLSRLRSLQFDPTSTKIVLAAGHIYGEKRNSNNGWCRPTNEVKINGPDPGEAREYGR